jgi:hypothetical protein
MERRTFLGVLTGTSLGALWKDSFAEFAREQNNTMWSWKLIRSSGKTRKV